MAASRPTRVGFVADAGGVGSSLAEQLRLGQDAGQHRAQQALGWRPLVVPFDPDPCLIDQMHVVNA
jgi:hypothetical protein